LISRLPVTLKERGVLLAVALCVALPACEALQRLSPFRSQPAPTPSAQAAAPTPSARPTAAAAKVEKHRRTVATAKPKATQPDMAPVLSLAPGPDPPGEQSAEQHAESVLDQATKELATVDRSKLDGQRVNDYDLVAGLINSAQAASREGDFVKAESLGEKASVLARLLATTGAPVR
jgi:hypothetical protein